MCGTDTVEDSVPWPLDSNEMGMTRPGVSVVKDPGRERKNHIWRGRTIGIEKTARQQERQRKENRNGGD